MGVRIFDLQGVEFCNKKSKIEDKSIIAISIMFACKLLIKNVASFGFRNKNKIYSYYRAREHV